MLRKIRFVLLTTVALALCASAAVAYTSHQTWDLKRVNHVRKAHGVKPDLYLGRKMTKRAQAWANYLAKHNSEEQDDVAGASVCWKSGGRYYGGNSAIAYGYPNDVAEDQYAMEQSRPHMINRHFQWVGIGIASDRNGLIVVQDFCGK